MNAPAIFDDLTTLADATRGRMLLMLERQELTVSELCAVLQLPQSTVSRQLKTLSDAAWVTSRRDGTSRYYALRANPMSAGQTQLWALTRSELAGRPGVDQDARRLAQVLARRSRASQQFFAAAAGDWDRLRAELFGGNASLQALVALLPKTWTVGDLGCGTGALISLIAPHVTSMVG